MGYPMIFDGQIRLYSLYKLCVCCSPRCVKLASLLVNLPLLYPNDYKDNMAVVLVEAPLPEEEDDDGGGGIPLIVEEIHD